MSGTRRQRDTLAPSLFPFLAVLLCTMGALVLILMLIVAGAQTSAREVAAESQLKIEEAEELLDHTKNAFTEQLTEGRIALEKKRLILQHLEAHIQELLDELADLKRTAELVDEDRSNDTEDEKDRKQSISELEKQLAEATQELEKKLEKPEGDKPIFAIIPYQGNNGTHRRPIYLECTADGVVIQPEGIRLTKEDLEPPYGPGNPLDAALRTIRAEFPPSNGAVTSTAYPLLVVRPSGIRTYTLARAAMSGWDDQFGYELINEDLELAFPESTVGLERKLTKALELARDRQAALVMAMPNKYQQGSYRDFGASPGNEPGRGSSSGFASEKGQGDGRYAGNSPTAGSSSASAGVGRGGYSLSGDPPSLQNSAGYDSGAGMGFGAAGTQPESGSESLLASRGTGSGENQAGTNGLRASTEFGTGSDSGAAGSGDGSSSQGGAEASGGSNQDLASEASGSAGRAAGGSAGGSAGGAAMGPSGKQFQLPFGSPGGSSGGGQSGATQSTAQASERSTPPTTPGGSNANSVTASQQTSMSPQLSLNQDFTRSRKEAAQPVARARGRDWAWSQGPRNETPVVRSIRVQCLNDRWLVLPDSGSPLEPTVISFDASPKERAEQLARVVLDRVDSWGLALMGGYWKPILVVDVAPDAQWRYQQLHQLLEGSGLDVQLRAERNAPLRR